MYRFEIHQDIYEDAWNWWHACNSQHHGVDWKKKVDPDIVARVHGKDRQRAFQFLVPYILNKYREDKFAISEFKNSVTESFLQNFDRACLMMSKATNRPIYRNNFTFYITTFPRAPYNTEKGLVWLPVSFKDPMATFLHELCHFQFIHYWRNDEKSEVSKLSEGKFEFLKESLTIIIDEEFFPLIKKPDRGYEIHQAFRKELEKQWDKEKDFDKLVEYGLDLITNENISE